MSSIDVQRGAGSVDSEKKPKKGSCELLIEIYVVKYERSGEN